MVEFHNGIKNYASTIGSIYKNYVLLHNATNGNCTKVL